MTATPIQQLLDEVAADIAALPVSALQLVGALVALQQGVPNWLSAPIMAHLGQRVDMRVVSPAAEAVMRLSAFAGYSDMEFARIEIQMQHDLLKAVALDDKVFVAAAFMRRLAERLATAAQLVGAADVQHAGAAKPLAGSPS